MIASAWSPDWDNQMSPPIVQAQQPQPRPQSKVFGTGHKIALAVVVGLAVLLGIVFLA